MPVTTNAGGGGGATSDECTLVKANVPVGLKAVTADSNDEAAEGTLDTETSVSDSQVLEKQTYFKYNFATKRWEKRTGTRKNNGALNASLNCGESYTIPAGDTMGGKVTANSLASQTQGTALAADIMAGKIATVNGVKITGIKPDRGAWTGRIGVNGRAPIPEGYHNGSGYVDQSINDRGAWATSIGVNGIAYIPEGYHNGGGYINQSIATMGGPSITPQTYGQAIDVSGRYLTSNGYVAGVALPPAEALKKGYRYWIGGNYVDGNYQGYVDSPLYLFNSGAWGGLQTTGVTRTKGGDVVVNGSYIEFIMFNTDDKSYARLNQTVDLTNYKYLKMYTESNEWNIFDMCVGISTDPSIVLYSNLNAYNIITGVPASGTAILDISGFNGFYYIYIAVTRRGGSSGATGRVKQLFLSAT